MYEDKTLVCKECGQEFVFTAGEQEFYAERGFQNEPQRCKACRDAVSYTHLDVYKRQAPPLPTQPVSLGLRGSPKAAPTVSAAQRDC